MKRFIESICVLFGLSLWGFMNKGIGYLEGYYTAKCEDCENKE